MPEPFVLSLSKHCSFPCSEEQGQPFDKLRANGVAYFGFFLIFDA